MAMVRGSISKDCKSVFWKKTRAEPSYCNEYILIDTRTMTLRSAEDGGNDARVSSMKARYIIRIKIDTKMTSNQLICAKMLQRTEG